jgi:hypothetical protein
MKIPREITFSKNVRKSTAKNTSFYFVKLIYNNLQRQRCIVFVTATIVGLTPSLEPIQSDVRCYKNQSAAPRFPKKPNAQILAKNGEV